LDSQQLERYCVAPAEMHFGNRLTLLKNGVQAYPAMLDAITAANRSVHIESYIFKSDRTGWKFGQALAAAAARGVEVRLIFDAVGSYGIDREFLEGLKIAGVKILEFHPLALTSRLGQLQRRDHRKILVVDGTIGFCGGLNIGDEYASREDGGQGWRDNHVRVEGPAALALDAAFIHLWRTQTREHVPFPPRPTDGQGGARIRVVTNDTFLKRHAIRTAYLRALRAAQKSIEIENSYFVPDRGIRRALRTAAERGVKVKILVPDRSDVPVVQYASRAFYDSFLASGIRIFEYEGSILHAKTVVVDRVWCAVGSYNIDHRSLRHNLEINLHLTDAAFGEEAGRAFEEDLDRSVEVTAEERKRRPLSERLKEWAAYEIRAWL
jgi:cardiolipin synthase